MTIERFTGDYEFLSNFYHSPVVVHGHKYDTVEHAFQAQKAVDETRRAYVAAAPTPGGAKYRGKRVTLRPDWEQVKLNVMYECLVAKFTQNPDLAEKLLATGYDKLVEGNTWNDRYWGVCNGRGENHLGKLLMRVREDLRIAKAEVPNDS